MKILRTLLRVALITMTVGGGFKGVILTVQLLASSDSSAVVQRVLVVMFLALYGFVAACGLWFACDRRRVRPLLAALAIQIPWVSTPLVVYKFAAGLYAVVSVGGPQDAGDLGVRFGAEALFGSTFRVAWLQEIPWSVGVNVAALVFFVVLWKFVAASAQPDVGAGLRSAARV